MSKRSVAYRKIGTNGWASNGKRNILRKWMGGPDGSSLYLDFTEAPSFPANLLTFTRATVGRYNNSTGLNTEAAINAVRFDYNPSTLAARGLLIEGAGTNYFRATNDVNNAYWTKFRGTTAAADQVAPDGTTSMVKFKEDTTTQSHSFSRAVTLTAGSYWVKSVYVKASGRYRLRIGGRSNGFTNSIAADFNLNTLAVSAVAPVGTGVVNGSGIEATAMSGVYRIWLAGRTSATDTTVAFELSLLNDAGTLSYTGDGTSGMHYWGMNLIAASTQPALSSYIQNTGTVADVSRSGDFVSATSTVVGYNATASTDVVSFAFRCIAGTQSVIQYDDGTNNNRVCIEAVSGTLYARVTVSGSDTAALNLGSVVADTTYKVAFARTTDSFAASVNGGTAVTDVSGAMPTGITTCRLGANATAPSLGGWVQQQALYPSALSNVQGLSA
jgi:hypothetical protein